MAASSQIDANSGLNDNLKKPLAELKVTDLRNELERRSLDKNGIKSVLVDRLTAALIEEGIDPDEHLFSTGDTVVKGTGKRKGTTPSKMPLKDEKEVEKDSDTEATESASDQLKVEESVAAVPDLPKTSLAKVKAEQKPSRSGLEAADIVQDALQLDLDDELNEVEDRDNVILDLHVKKEKKPSAYDNKANEDRKTDENQVKHELKENGSGIASPPKPENAPVVAPLTIDDMLAMDTSSARKAEDDVSMIVNVDDTQSELDGDMDTSTASALTNDGKLAPGKETNGSSKSDEKPKSSRSDSKKESKDSSQESGKEAASEKEGDSKPSSKGKQSSSSSKDAASKATKDKKTSIPSRNVWVSGLSETTRASDLQTLFKNHGKVIGAKIITNPKMPGSRYYGLITMETAEQAEKAIQKLNKTELNGKTIIVGKNRPTDRPTVNRKDKIREKKDDSKKDKSDKRESKDEKKKSSSRDRTRSRSGSPRRMHMRPHFRGGMRRPFGYVRRGYGRPPLGFRPHTGFIRRMDQPDMRMRRDPREFDRRRVDLARQDVERKARDERERLDREKEKLRIERERLEREKAELLRLERDRARQEREKIEREREEIAARRRQAQLGQSRPMDDISRARPSSTVAAKRPYEPRDSDSWDERKRPMGMLSHAAALSQGFDVPTGSDFDARQSFDNRAEPYGKRKFDMNTTGGARGSDFERRDSRHGTDRDERRSAVSSYGYKDSRRPSSRERERRQGGRDEWKQSERRETGSSRYSDKPIGGGGGSGMAYQGNRFGGGGDREEWGVNDRNQSYAGMSKMSYGGGLDSRGGGGGSRGPLNPSLMGSSTAGLSTMFTGAPMGGIMSHANIPANSGLASSYDNRNMHNVNRRF